MCWDGHVCLGDEVCFAKGGDWQGVATKAAQAAMRWLPVPPDRWPDQAVLVLLLQQLGRDEDGRSFVCDHIGLHTTGQLVDLERTMPGNESVQRAVSRAEANERRVLVIIGAPSGVWTVCITMQRFNAGPGATGLFGRGAVVGQA